MGSDKEITTLHKAAQRWNLDDDLLEKAIARNGWFTKDGIRTAVGHWKKILTTENLLNFVSAYPVLERKESTVGIVMAGNVPLVGFHDLMCAILAGYRVSYKPSSDDEVLIDYVVESMHRIDPTLKDRITKVERMNEVDMVIATGSNNTARYFEYYFRDIPHLIRKNRTSVAVLTGTESEEDLNKLSVDVFSYFGKGCRNVSSVFLPDEETLQRFLKALDKHGEVMNNHKYANNYTYHKAIWLLNKDPFYDTGSICVKETSDIHSPLGTLYFSRYGSLDDVRAAIQNQRDEIQAVVGSATDLCDTPFGESQFPPLAWFADNIDTLDFITKNHQETI